MSDQPAGNPGPEPPRSPSFEQRIEGLGRDVEAAGERLAKNPGVQSAADSAARAWGLLVLAVGLWFLAEVTLGYDMPSIPWRDIWPLGLIFVGLVVVFRGMRRRDA